MVRTDAITDTQTDRHPQTTAHGLRRDPQNPTAKAVGFKKRKNARILNQIYTELYIPCTRECVKFPYSQFTFQNRWQAWRDEAVNEENDRVRRNKNEKGKFNF